MHQWRFKISFAIRKTLKFKYGDIYQYDSSIKDNNIDLHRNNNKKHWMKIGEYFSKVILYNTTTLWSTYYCVLRQGKIWLCSEMRLFWLENTQILCFSSLLSETTTFICPKIELAYIQEDFVLFCHVFDLWCKTFLKI